MGRSLAEQLTAEGCHIAICDVSDENMRETRALCEAHMPPGTRISLHLCDVSDESQVVAFRDEVIAQYKTRHINLLFNNAGIVGGGSFVNDDRTEWERTFGVCWFGVYYCTRAFLPLLVASDAGYIINTSSISGFWASLGPRGPHTAYSTAKFTVKGFSESLLVDLRMHAPHVKVAVVMPGHVGTSIGINTPKVLGNSDAVTQRALDFRDHAPTTAAQAATIILDGVRGDAWRILVGEDAHEVDRLVRESPETAYEPSLLQALHEKGHLPWIE